MQLQHIDIEEMALKIEHLDKQDVLRNKPEDEFLDYLINIYIYFNELYLQIKI